MRAVCVLSGKTTSDQVFHQQQITSGFKDRLTDIMQNKAIGPLLNGRVPRANSNLSQQFKFPAHCFKKFSSSKTKTCNN